MSNRLMGLLIVLAFILAGIGFYVYSFVSYTGKLVITTNVENYVVELQNKKTLNEIKKSCSKNKCELNDVPPFEFKIIISKEGYRNYENTISIEKSELKSLVVALQKDTKLVGLTIIGEKEEIAGDGKKNETVGEDKNTKIIPKELLPKKATKILSKKEKIQQFKNRRNYYKYFEINNFGEIFFKIEGNKVNVYYTDELAKQRKIANFSNKVEKSSIRVEQIEGKDHIVFIKYGDEKFLYNAQLASFDQFVLKIPIKYIKSGIGRSLQFVTEKGTFIYKNKKFEYFSMFEDFVYNDGNYIGIINDDDERRKKNLNFNGENGTLVVLHNPNTKEKRVLLKPQFEVGKIVIENEKIVLKDISGKQFSLENY